ncbi:DNA cytosine methyltransferase [bacterium]|nr:DNA cytosine methyltransferase [bacterium]
MTDKRTVVSLFSGAGGFDWGFRQADFITQLAVEIEAAPAQTLAHNLHLVTVTPDALASDSTGVVIHGDVQAVDFRRIAHLQPDVVIGGPPCQDFSVMTGHKRKGIDGRRGTLYREFLRALMFLQPAMFVFENVPGLTSANKGEAYKTILTKLQDLEQHRREVVSQAMDAPGNPVQNYVLLFNGIVDAPTLGIPQTRRRLIVIGIRADIISAKQESLTDWQQTFEQALTGKGSIFSRFPITTLEIFEGKPLNELGDVYKSIMREYESLVEEHCFPQVQQWHENVWQKLTLDVVQDYFAALSLDYQQEYDEQAFENAMQEHKSVLQELGWLHKPVHTLKCVSNNCPPQKQPVQDRMCQIPPGENAEFVDGTEWRVTNKKISFIYRRSYLLKPAWTVMAYGGGGTYGYHYQRNRQQLTLRERARIQTFPDDFKFMGVDVRAQIGEAVPPLLGKRIATIVHKVLTEVCGRSGA